MGTAEPEGNGWDPDGRGSADEDDDTGDDSVVVDGKSVEAESEEEANDDPETDGAAECGDADRTSRTFRLCSSIACACRLMISIITVADVFESLATEGGATHRNAGMGAP